MNKIIYGTLAFCFTLCISVNAQTIEIESFKKATHKWDQNITIHNTGATSTSLIQDSKIESTGQIRFDNTIVQLDKSTIICDEIIFENSVTNLIITGAVQIICKKITIINTGGPTLNITKGTRPVCNLSITYAESFNYLRNIHINDAESFTVSFFRK